MRIRIRKWRLDDAAAYAAILTHKCVQQNLRDGLPCPFTVADANAFLSSMLENDQYAWAIVLPDDTVVGSIGVVRKENIHRLTGEVGYCVAPEWWGRGIATAAVCLACEEMFLRTDVLRLFAQPYAYNTASCRVLEKAGFQLEGLLRKNAVKDGKILDMKLYAHIKES